MKPQSHLQKSILIDRAMELWGMYGESFRTNIQTYYALLDEKKACNLKLDKLKWSVIRQYPKNHFLSIEDESSARSYVEQLEVGQLKRLIERIEHIVRYDHAYNSVKSRIYEYKYQLKHRNDPRSEFTRFDPDWGGTHSRVSRTTSSPSLGD